MSLNYFALCSPNHRQVPLRVRGIARTVVMCRHLYETLKGGGGGGGPRATPEKFLKKKGLFYAFFKIKFIDL